MTRTLMLVAWVVRLRLSLVMILENETVLGVLTLNDPEGLQEDTFKFNSSTAVTDMAVFVLDC